jgi:hypothetical protein
MKSPPVQHPDSLARELTEAFIRGDAEIRTVPPSEAEVVTDPIQA